MQKALSQPPTGSAMLAQKPQKTPAEIEDIILRKIFLISLTGSASSDPKVVYLELTAAEILSEGRPLLLCRDLLERVLIDRLSQNFPGADPPFHYLVGCYRRAYEEGKKVGSMKDKGLRSEMESVIRQAKKLAVSYCRIHLGIPDTFASGDGVKDRKLLLPLIFSEVSSAVDGFGGSSSGAGGLSCPPGFLEEFLRDSDSDSLEPILSDLYDGLRQSVLNVSALGNFQQPLRALMMLVTFPNCAKCLVANRWWIPKGAYVNGRVMEMTSILGPFFHVSALPDHGIFKSQPDVGQQCFSEASTRRPADLMSSLTTIRTVMNNLYDGLREILLALLKNTDTRESVLEYLAELIKRNASRSHIQVDPLSCASSGMFFNFSAVMLQLCEPFLDANLTKRDKIDPKYVFYNSRLDLRGLTALHASSEEVAAWIGKDNCEKIEGLSHRSDEENRLLQSQEATSSGNSTSSVLSKAKPLSSCGVKNKYPFICECFFMTARVLNLGLLKAFSDFKHLDQDLSRCKETLSTLKAMQGQGASPQLELDIARLEKEIELYSQEKLCYEAQMMDGALLQRALSFYRLMVVWLVGLVGGFKMPLPSQCPMEFACMPEHFVEDVMELLIFACRFPKALDGFMLEEFLNFIIMFMASPSYVRNPYLRAKMVEVLNYWMQISRSSGSLSSGIPSSISSAILALFEGNQLALEYLVRNLLNLYVDIEFTGSHTQFYDKFNIRHNIAELLEYLWNVPSHCNAWRQIAREEEKGVYLNFLNFLINDSIYLLDESLNKIPEVKGIEAEMANTAEWERRPAQERQDRTRLFHSLENIIRIDMKLANEDIGMLVFTSEQISAPFLFEVPISFHGEISTAHHHLKRPTSSLSSSGSFPHLTTKHTHMRKNHRIKPTRPLSDFSSQYPRASNVSTTQVEEQAEVEVAEGYTMTKFCDKMIDVFMTEKPRTKDWRKLLVFRDEWNKYKDNFYNRCQARADAENDSIRKQEFIRLARKVKKIDDEMERHADLLKEIQENPTDINAVVARRRDDFTGEFFRHLNVLSETYDSLEDRDAMARLGAKCLSAVSAYDNAVENVEMLDVAQSKFNDILNSPSLDTACEKIKSLAKAKELDSSLILLINKAWASAKESTTMKNEVKDIMYHLYRTTKSCLRSIAPKEIKLLKYLLNITDPEERFSALATAFSPGDEREAKDVDVLYTTPQELHKWIKILLEAYHINKEETDLREARQLSHPMVIQRLFILKETIEEEYMKQRTEKGGPETKEADEDISL